MAPLTTSGGATAPATLAPPTQEPSVNEVPDSPMTTNAVALSRPQRGSSAPVGAIVFGNDVTSAAQRVSLDSERTTFTSGRPIAWRVTLPAAIGGESVRVTLTTEDNTETLVDEFVAQAGWNVYYGKSLLTVAQGTYVLHYLVDGHEVGSGTFKIKASSDETGATPTPYFVPTDPPVVTPGPTPTAAPPTKPSALQPQRLIAGMG